MRANYVKLLLDHHFPTTSSSQVSLDLQEHVWGLAGTKYPCLSSFRWRVFLTQLHPPTIKASLFHTVSILLLSMTEQPPTSSVFPSAAALREPLRNINDVCSRGGETNRRVKAWMLADSHSRRTKNNHSFFEVWCQEICEVLHQRFKRGGKTTLVNVTAVL